MRRLLGLTLVPALPVLLVLWFLWLSNVFATTPRTVTYVGYTGHVLTSIDGRTLTLGGFQGTCGADLEVIATESVRKVALRLKYTSPPAVHIGACAQGMVMAVDAHLHTPLGNRTIVNGDDDVPLPFFDARQALHPAQIPLGYTLMYASPVVIGTGNKALLGCTQVWQGNAAQRIQLTQIIGALADLANVDGYGSTPTSTPITVRRHRGVHIAPGVIRWTEGTQAMQLEWIANPPPTTATVIALADSSQ